MYLNANSMLGRSKLGVILRRLKTLKYTLIERGVFISLG